MFYAVTLRHHTMEPCKRHHSTSPCQSKKPVHAEIPVSQFAWMSTVFEGVLGFGATVFVSTCTEWHCMQVLSLYSTVTQPVRLWHMATWYKADRRSRNMDFLVSAAQEPQLTAYEGSSARDEMTCFWDAMISNQEMCLTAFTVSTPGP